MPKKYTKLSPKLIQRIVLYLRRGNYVETAAAAAGISKVTLYDWIKKGARLRNGKKEEFTDEEKLLIRCSEDIDQAVALAEDRDVNIIHEAAETQWQAAAWRLERKHFARWGRKEKIEHSGKIETPNLQVVIQKPNE
jgi:transposase